MKYLSFSEAFAFGHAGFAEAVEEDFVGFRIDDAGNAVFYTDVLAVANVKLKNRVVGAPSVAL